MPIKHSWQMAVNELKPKYAALLGNVLLTLLFGYMVGRVFTSAVIGQPALIFFNLVYPGDLFFFLWLPLSGALFTSKEYMSWSMLSDEPFQKKLTFYRMWAIPLKVVVWGKMLNMIICLLANFSGFAIGFVLSCWPILSDHLSLSAFAGFIIVIFFYTIAMGGINPYLEFVFNGRTVLIFTIGYFIVFIGLVAAVTKLIERPIHILLLDSLSATPLISIIIAAIAAAFGIVFFTWLLHRKLKRMDFL